MSVQTALEFIAKAANDKQLAGDLYNQSSEFFVAKAAELGFAFGVDDLEGAVDTLTGDLDEAQLASMSGGVGVTNDHMPAPGGDIAVGVTNDHLTIPGIGNLQIGNLGFLGGVINP